MEKEKFFSGLWIIIGLIFGSVFTNFVYQDYLAYGGTVRSLVLNNTDLYKASISLFFYILLKGENNMHLFIWGHIFCNLGFFYTVLHFVWHFSLDQCYLCRSCKWASKDWFLYL